MEKIFELIKEITGLFFGRDFFVGTFQNICAVSMEMLVGFFVNIPYEQERKVPDEKLNIHFPGESQKRYGLLSW